MMKPDDKTVTLSQAMAAQAALRDKLGLGPEHFPMPEFIGMLSDEIEKLRAAGHSDADIAKLVSDAVKDEVTADQIGSFYASPEDRHHGPA